MFPHAPSTCHPEPVEGSFCYNIQARIDRLAVAFRPLADGSGFTDVYLTGPAEEIGRDA